MAHVPGEPWSDDRKDQPSIVVLPLKQNKRPVGFAPWPDLPKRKKRKKKK
jgi:hypothetical protein